MTAFLKLEITVCFCWLSLPVHSGSLNSIVRSRPVWPIIFLLNVSTALRGTFFYLMTLLDWSPYCEIVSQKI